MADQDADSHDRQTLDEDMEESGGEDSDDVFEVEKIVGTTKIDGEVMYKVRWVGYGPSHDTYEPYDNLLSCTDMIEEFLSQQKEQKRKREEEKKKKYDIIAKQNPEGPKLRDPFWDDLEKGKINVLDGHDMYSKIKSGRAARPTSFKDSKEQRNRRKTAEGESERQVKHKRSKTTGDAAGSETKKKTQQGKHTGKKSWSYTSQDNVGSKGSYDGGGDDVSVSGDSLDCSHSSIGTSLGSVDESQSQSQSVGDEPMDGSSSQDDSTSSTLSQESLKTLQSDSGFTASKESSQISSQNSDTSTKHPEKAKSSLPLVSKQLIKSPDTVDIDDDDFLPDLSYVPRSSSKLEQQTDKNQKLKDDTTTKFDKSASSKLESSAAVGKKSEISSSVNKKSDSLSGVNKKSESTGSVPGNKKSESSVGDRKKSDDAAGTRKLSDSSTSSDKKSDILDRAAKKSMARSKKVKDVASAKSSSVPLMDSEVKDTQNDEVDLPELTTRDSKDTKPVSQDSGVKDTKSDITAEKSSGTKDTKTDQSQAAVKLSVRTTSRDSISSRRIQVIDAMPILNPEIPVIKGKQHRDDHKSSRRSSKDDRSSKRSSHRGSLDGGEPVKVKTWEERRASIDNAPETKVSGTASDQVEALGDKDLEALGLEFDDIAMDIDEWEKKEAVKSQQPSGHSAGMTMAELRNAIKSQDYNRLRLALSNPEDCKKYDLESPDSSGVTLLMMAAQLGNVDICELLAMSGANVNAMQKNGNTPLMQACENGHCTVVGTLLEMGSFINLQGSHGETAIIKAVRRGHNQVVKLLLSHGANFATPSGEGMTALKLASITKNTEGRDLITAHVSKLTSVFETCINIILNNNAKVLCALFPIQCFCLYEGDRFKVNFKHELNPTVPGFGMLLFIAHAKLSPEIKCRLHGSCAVKSVVLNGVTQAPLTEDGSFVMSFSPLHNGQNELEIRTVLAPQSRAKLVVCAYKAQLIGPPE